MHPKIIKEPIVLEVEKYITVKSKSKYNKNERLKAELQSIVLNLMDNPIHRNKILDISEKL